MNYDDQIRFSMNDYISFIYIKKYFEMIMFKLPPMLLNILIYILNKIIIYFSCKIDHLSKLKSEVKEIKIGSYYFEQYLFI